LKVIFLLLQLLFTFISTNALADWSHLATASGSDHFIDTSTLKYGARPTAWTLINFANATEEGDKSYKILREADCEGNKLRGIAWRYYKEGMGAGKLSGIDDTPGEWRYVSPESVTEILFKILCKKNN
jgi:hypothetical protein